MEESDSRCRPRSLQQSSEQFADRVRERELTDFVKSRRSSNLVGMECLVRLSGLRRHSILSQTKDIWNDVSCFRDLSSSLHPKRDLNVRKRFRIGIILRILSESLLFWHVSSCSSTEADAAYLVDDELLERNLASANVFTTFRQKGVNFLDDAFRIRSRQNVTQYISIDLSAIKYLRKE